VTISKLIYNITGALMMAISTIVPDVGAGIGIKLTVDPDGDSLYYVEYTRGNLIRFYLPTSTSETVATGLINPEDVAIDSRTNKAYVTQRSGELLEIDLRTRTKRTIVDGMKAPQQIALHRTNIRGPDFPTKITRILTAFIVEYDSGELTFVNIGTRTKRTLLTGLAHPVGIALSNPNLAYVTEQDRGSISQVNMNTKTITPIVTGLVAPFFLEWDSSKTGLYVTERDPANRISKLNLSTGPVTLDVVVSGLDFRPSGVSKSTDEAAFYVTTDRTLQKVTLRSAFLEIDRMQGTEFPPTSVYFDGKYNTLQGIYLKSGIIVDIRRDENAIPDLAGPDNEYTDAELHNLMTSHRNPIYRETGNKMSAYLVVATNYVQDGILGVMFDSSTRLGCAVFHGHDLIRTDPRAFLRTSAHEAGHQFNLHHEDGTTFTDGGGLTKYTIMNQTWLITPWPDAIGFIFGDHETVHLASHPISNVKPGGGAFYDCDTEHSGWHGGIT